MNGREGVVDGLGNQGHVFISDASNIFQRITINMKTFKSGFVTVADAAVLTEALCVQEERVVDRANTVSWGRLKLQLPPSPLRAHFVKARVRVHEYPDGALAVFHGPRCIARYNARGEEMSAVPICASATPCSPPSRRGLSRAELVESPARRPSLTAAALGVTGPMQVGTKKPPSGRTKKLTLRKPVNVASAAV
jgi:hypothetical protein